MINKKKEQVSLGIYFDFDNFWAGLLDTITTISKQKLSEQAKKDIEQKFTQTINKILPNENIKFIKAYSDFDKLPFSKDLNMIDLLHNKGIQTYMPYVRGNKDMADRALIISVIKDIIIEKKKVEKIIIVTGDIDYLPLFEFLAEDSEVDFELLSFENRFNTAYKDVFYIKNKIRFIDTLIKEKSKELEYEKKLKAFQKYLRENNLSIMDKLNYRKIASQINSENYFRINHNLIRQFVQKLKQEHNKSE